MPKALEASIFNGVTSLDDVATVLGSSSKQLRYLLYGKREAARYTVFTIAKRRGGVREIKAPGESLKSIQRRLAAFLQIRLRTRPAAHGFVRERSVATNAALHVGQRTVFNVDLKDFFPSINFGRVRGLFMADPIGALAPAATVLAQICCHEDALPQGAPTSPVISNMICWRLDAQLLRLSREHGCVYTRYADDMTFSKRKGVFPAQLAVEDPGGNFVVGKELRAIIEMNGFHIHPDKVRLFRNTHRQTVTGLTVNSKVNVPRSFVRSIRAMIHDWRTGGQAAAESTHHSAHYRHPNRRVKKPELHSIIEGKLSFLGMVKGVQDPVRKNLQRQFVRVFPKYQKTMDKENGDLMKRDLFISHASEDKTDFVLPLVTALIREGVSVWYDEYEMTIGDDLVAKVNEGLLASRFGVVVLSPNFFGVKKTWPDREVGALLAMEDVDKRPRVLPIWHNVDKPIVAARSPMLAGKLAWTTAAHSPDELAVKFKALLKSRP